MRWTKYILAILFILTISISAFSTPQVLNKLIYKGDTVSVYLNLLPKEFYKTDIKFAESILAINIFGEKEACWTTACSYGYLAMWEIDENQLYLIGIYSCCFYKDSIKADLNSLFKEKVVNGKVKADWVTQKKIEGGKGFILWNNEVAVYKQEFEFDILNGKLQNTKVFDNAKSKESIYSLNSMKLEEFIYSHIHWDKLPIKKEKNKVVVRFSANKDGKVDQVEIIKQSNDKKFDIEAVRVVKLIPDWNVIYIKGQHSRQIYTLPIIFSEVNREKYRE